LTAVPRASVSRPRVHRRLPARWRNAISFTIVGLPFIGAIIRTFRGSGRLGGDDALTELAVRAVGTHAVLVGPYSRFGWNHPGPLYFYVLAPFYWLFGADGRAITAGAILIGLVSALTILVFARRRGGSGLMLWTAVVLALFLWHLDDAFWNSWPPFVTLLPVTAFLLAAWSFACVDRWALPIAVAMGSFAVQTHIGYAPLVLGVGVAALTVWLVRVRRRPEILRAWRSPVVIAVGLFVLAWIPPMIDAAVHDPSNVEQLLDFRADRVRLEAQTVGEGWVTATRGLSGFLDGRADLADNVISGRSASWLSLVTASGLVLATTFATRRRRWDVLVLLGLVVVAFALSVYAISEVAGPLFNHLVVWTSVLSVMAWVAVGAGVLPDVERSRAAAPMTAAVAVLGLTALTLAWPGIAPADTGSAEFEAMVSRVERQVPADRSVVVRLASDPLWPWGTALVSGLRQDGFDVHGERRKGAMSIVFEPRDLKPVRRDDVVVTVVWSPSECEDTAVCAPIS
jgi:hypothetical protein